MPKTPTASYSSPASLAEPKDLSFLVEHEAWCPRGADRLAGILDSHISRE